METDVADDEPVTINAYQLEHWRKLVVTMNHHWQRSMVEEQDLRQQVKLLRKQVADLQAIRDKDAAAIGEVMERLDKSSTAFRAMRDDIKELKSAKVIGQ